MAWSITTDKLVFDTGADAKWTDKIYASNDEGTYPELGRIDDVSVGKKAVLTANVTLNGDFSGLDGAEVADGTYNAIQLSCAIKTGDGWTYTKSDDYPFLKAENFTDGKTQVSFAFDVEDTGVANEIIFQYNSNSAYTGTISISDVEIQSDDSGEEPGGGSSATGNVTGVAKHLRSQTIQYGAVQMQFSHLTPLQIRHGRIRRTPAMTAIHMLIWRE